MTSRTESPVKTSPCLASRAVPRLCDLDAGEKGDRAINAKDAYPATIDVSAVLIQDQPLFDDLVGGGEQ